MAIGWLYSAVIGSAGIQIKVNRAKMLTSIEERIRLFFGIASYSNIYLFSIFLPQFTNPKCCYPFITRCDMWPS
jgi:hypothetical protein